MGKKDYIQPNDLAFALQREIDTLARFFRKERGAIPTTQ
jgi:hypothetical protein